MSTFVGRGGELAQVESLLDEHRIVTITGPGGVGKSRLADEAMARDGPRTVVTIPLADVPVVADADGVAGVIALSTPEAVAVRVGRDAGVVVIDGCERHLEAVADFVLRLLAASDALSVLVTSREPLRLSDEVVYPLAPLAVPTHAAADVATSPSVELFLDRARAAGATWAVTDAALMAIGDLCRRVDGLPLAIELAAARARALTPHEVVFAIDERLETLRIRARDVPARHRSVTAAIAVSVDLLDEREARFFRHLGVFGEPFEASLAHVVASADGDEIDTVDLLGDLVDRSLLVAESRGPTTRYRMLALVHDDAVDELRRRDEWDSARERLAATMATIADEIVAEGIRRWSASVLARVSAHASDLVSAIDWCIQHDDGPERAYRLYMPLFAAAHQRRTAAVRSCGERLFAHWPTAPAPRRGEALAVLATAVAMTGDTERVAALTDAVMEDHQVTGVGRALALRAVALDAIGREDWAAASSALARAIDAADEVPLPPFARELTAFAAIVADRTGAGEAAEALVARAVSESDVVHDPITELWGLVAATTIAAWGERWTEVLALVQRARAVAAPLSDGWWDGAVFRSGVYLSLYETAALALTEGWSATADRWADAVERAEHDGDVAGLGVIVSAAAAVAGRCGRDDLAGLLAAAVPPARSLRVVPVPFAVLPGPLAGEPFTASLRTALLALRAPAAPAPAAAPAPEARPAIAEPPAILRRDGDGWEVTFRTATGRVRDLKGLCDLAALVARPGEQVHCLELMGASDLGATGPTLDERARREYRDRILDLQSDIDDARDAHDPARAERAEVELDALVAQLTEAFGIGGRDRASRSSAERARGAVTYRIRAAIGKVGAAHPALGRHLSSSVRTGAWCSYDPETPVAWEVHAG